MPVSLKKKIMIGGFAVIALTIIIWWLSSGTEIHAGGNDSIEVTPVQVEQIRSIGQWEFLTVSDEELVDTIRHGFFGDDELTRIYYGTLRLGIDLSEAPDDFITMDKDTAVVKLPPVKLLDDNFLDEARTKSFIEDGKWTDADRAALAQKAKRAMRQRCLTKRNIANTEANARRQMTEMLMNMGAKGVRFTR